MPQAAALRRAVADIKNWPDRMVAELMAELAEKHADLPTMLATFFEWQRRVVAVRAAGGDRFPRRRPRVVPTEMARASA